MIGGGAVLELRLRRSMRVFVAVSIPAFAALGMDHPWEEIRAALGAHVPDTPFDLEGPPGART